MWRCEFGFEEFACVAHTALGQALGGALVEQLATAASAFGPHVDKVVGNLDDVEVVLNDYHRVATVDKALQHVHEHAYVFEMEACGGFVEYVDGLSGVAL